MKSIKEKAEEYAKTKHTNLNLIEIVSWDFEAGANYVLEQVERLLDSQKFVDNPSEELFELIDNLKSNKAI